MRPTLFLLGVLTVGLAPGIVRAEDHPIADTKGPANKTDVPKNPDSDLRRILEGVARLIREIDQSQRPKVDPNELSLPLDSDYITSRVKALEFLAAAQWKIGDREEARRTWEEAVTAFSEARDSMRNLDFVKEFATLQSEFGDRSEALVTLRQAIHSTKSSDGSQIAVDLQSGEPDWLKFKTFLEFAKLQAKLGERDAARQAFRQAIEVADTVKNGYLRVCILAKVGDAEDRADANETWQRAIRIALALEPYQRGKAIELIIRSKIKSGAVDEALRLIADTLTGDLRAYGVWVAADVLTSVDRAVPRAVASRMLEIAESVKLDRDAKRVKVLTGIALLQAKQGDSDGAYRTLAKLEALNILSRYRFQQSKIKLIWQIAQAEVKAGEFHAAQDNLQVLLEIIPPFRGEDGDSTSFLEDIAELQAKAGDFRGGLGTAESIQVSSSKISALSKVAAVQAEKGRKADALKTIERAERAVGSIPDDTLWLWATEEDVTTILLETLMPAMQSLAASNVQNEARQAIAVARAKASDIEGALKLAQSLREPDGEPTGEAVGIIEEVVRTQLATNNFAGALETADILKSVRDSSLQKRREAILETIAAKQTDAREPKKVLEWISKLESPDEKLVALRGLAESVVRRNDRDTGAPPIRMP